MAFICPENSNRSKFKYEFSWLVWLNDMIPIIRRKVRIFSWFAIPFKELNNMYFSFLERRCQYLFESAANSQSIVLERFLNMLFDNTDRGIVIENIGSNFETLYVYRKGEQPSAGDDIYLYNRDESIPPTGGQEYLFKKSEVELSVDFIVKIPSAIYPLLNLEQVKAIVDLYKSIGTTYRIEQY
tara:strand:- start:863 stop:1414 length:552 start_codon:yes stop_codon:yes gene_type:complete